MCIDFGGHRVDPNPLYIICPNLSTYITHILPLVGFMEDKYVPVNIVVFNLRYQSCRSLVRKRRRKLGYSTVLKPSCVVTLVTSFAVVRPISHFSANASGETPFRIVDEIELIFTCSSNDDMKELILTCGLGVGLVVFGHEGRGTLTLKTSLLGFFIVLISPFQFVISLYC